MWPTLKNRKQFDLVYSQGRKRTSKSLVVFYLDNAPDRRVAYVASRKVGGAVQRNRAKRLLREALRQAAASQTLPVGWFVLVARGRILESRSSDVERELASALDNLENPAAG
jgi:ribonuclease P protein component